jgi:enolase
MKIKNIHARQILDSRGFPTVEADVILDNDMLGRAAVPSGASTGIHEALELRDGDVDKYLGKSVYNAVSNANSVIRDALIGMDASSQKMIDQKMIDLDGTKNKSKLGANAILAVSLASAKAAAQVQNVPLYKYFAELAGNKRDLLLPLPMMNVINGGKHGAWGTDIQEFIMFPVGAKTFSGAVEMGSVIFHTLGKILKENGYSTMVGDEGGYAPVLRDGNPEAFQLMSQAVEKAGYTLGDDVVFGIDAAASEYFEGSQSGDKYTLKSENKQLNTDEMIDYLEDLVTKYPIVSLEDALEQEGWSGWVKLTERLGKKIQIVGDDLLVTNPLFIKKGIELKAANAVIIKFNQIGTLSETIEAVSVTRDAGWNPVIAHRSGETEDTTMAHLAVGLSTGQIKPGSLSRSDRLAKYNELLRIEEQLGEGALFAGREALKK